MPTASLDPQLGPCIHGTYALGKDRRIVSHFLRESKRQPIRSALRYRAVDWRLLDKDEPMNARRVEEALG